MQPAAAVEFARVAALGAVQRRVGCAELDHWARTDLCSLGVCSVYMYLLSQLRVLHQDVQLRQQGGLAVAGLLRGFVQDGTKDSHRVPEFAVERLRALACRTLLGAWWPLSYGLSCVDYTLCQQGLAVLQCLS